MKKRIAILLLIIISLCFTTSCSNTVYITDTGTKYHRSSCNSLWNSKHAIDIDKAIEDGYEPCERFNP